MCRCCLLLVSLLACACPRLPRVMTPSPHLGGDAKRHARARTKGAGSESRDCGPLAAVPSGDSPDVTSELLSRVVLVTCVVSHRWRRQGATSAWFGTPPTPCTPSAWTCPWCARPLRASMCAAPSVCEQRAPPHRGKTTAPSGRSQREGVDGRAATVGNVSRCIAAALQRGNALIVGAVAHP